MGAGKLACTDEFLMIEIYTQPHCVYCHRAKRLLDSKGVSYQEHHVASDPKVRQTMIERTHARTTPQIIIDGKCIGGSDDLYALEKAGKLDSLLESHR